MNMGAVKERIELWRQYMTDIPLYYAVKANNDENLLRFILEQGCNFDCAS